ncbi:hypothetical protein BC629DRAFT_794410 [Irpex lacteus]|nr:hypothetical protein BC629DRAFT_794410 [Irpex lacteus]
MLAHHVSKPTEGGCPCELFSLPSLLFALLLTCTIVRAVMPGLKNLQILRRFFKRTPCNGAEDSGTSCKTPTWHEQWLPTQIPSTTSQTSTHHLPTELLIQIFLRIPLVSLLNCRSFSRHRRPCSRASIQDRT